MSLSECESLAGSSEHSSSGLAEETEDAVNVPAPACPGRPSEPDSFLGSPDETEEFHRDLDLMYPDAESSEAEQAVEARVAPESPPGLMESSGEEASLAGSSPQRARSRSPRSAPARAASPSPQSSAGLSDDVDELSDEELPQAVNRQQPVCRQEGLLQQSMTWAVFLLGALTQIMDIGDLQRSYLGQDRQSFYSTHCSGMGCPEMALLFLGKAAQVYGRLRMRLQNAASCDISHRCRNLLQVRTPESHVFSDIFEKFPGWQNIPVPENLLNSLPREILHFAQQLYRLRAAYEPGKACVCATHKQCCLEPDVISGDVSGTPCPPWSRMGKRLGWADGRAMVTCAWVAKLLEQKLTWAVHENVSGFDVGALDYALQRQYHICHLSLSPADLGFTLSRRPRLYSILVRKDAVSLVREPHVAWESLK